VRKVLKVDGRDLQNREKNAPTGRFTCMEYKRWLDVGSGESKAKGILFFEY
jgi:hypothetical protein